MSEVGKSVLKGAQEALAYAKGDNKSARVHKVSVPARINVRNIRDHLQMSRQEFADEFGFRVRTLEKWERGERLPEGPTRAYLMVIAKNPRAVRKALTSL